MARVETPAHNEPDRNNRRSNTDAVPDPIMSGADAVEKTTYAADAHGTDAHAEKRGSDGVTASVRAGGSSPLIWIAAVLALLALVAYAAALFS
jgi:hypothetical protein